MWRTGILPALLLLTVSLCLASSAEARKRSWRHYDHGFSVRFGDDHSRNARRTRIEGRGTRAPDRGTRAAESAEDPTNANPDGRAFGAVIDRLIRACLQQAAEFQSWPFEDIARIAAPDDSQRGALEALRGAAAAAAQQLSANCPQEVPAPWERLGAVEQSIDAATAAFAAVEPTLQGFYAALDDEQKARLVRDMTLSNAQARVGERAVKWPEQRSQGSDASVDRPAGGNRWTDICEDLTAALRSWRISEIERGLRLSEPQRVALYELVTSSLKAAEVLAKACPAEAALTAVSRMRLLRARLAAVRQATTAIQPTLTRFYEALDQGQRVRFAEMR
jgi:LTXXQ motif family protein